MDDKARKRAFENFTPRANAPVAAQTQQSPLNLAAIDGMDAIALRALIRTCYGVLAGFALLNDEEKAEAARLKLYSLGMTSNEVHKVVPALDKWFDRTVGKPQQSQVIEHKGSVATINYTATDRFLESLGIKVIEHE